MAECWSGSRIPDSGNLREFPGDVVSADLVISCKTTKNSPPKLFEDAERYRAKWGRPRWMVVQRFRDDADHPLDVVSLPLDHLLTILGDAYLDGTDPDREEF